MGTAQPVLECPSVTHVPSCHTPAVGLQLAQLTFLLGPLRTWASQPCWSQSGQERKAPAEDLRVFAHLAQQARAVIKREELGFFPPSPPRVTYEVTSGR